MSGIFARGTYREQVRLRFGSVIVAVMLLLSLVACKEDKKEDSPAEQVEILKQEQEPIHKPGIFVGNVQVEFEAPEHFSRVDSSSPAILQAQASLDSGKVLLALYVPSAQQDGAQGVEPEASPDASPDASPEASSGTAPDAISEATPDAAAGASSTSSPGSATVIEIGASFTPDSDFLMVTTLEKWLLSNFSESSFAEFIAGWQKDSLVCDEQVLSSFATAASTRLADYSAYTYKLGMAGHGPAHLTFASVSKSVSADGSALYVCHLKTLLHRQGKILALSYNRRLESVDELAQVINGYLDYLEALQKGTLPEKV